MRLGKRDDLIVGALESVSNGKNAGGCGVVASHPGEAAILLCPILYLLYAIETSLSLLIYMK